MDTIPFRSEEFTSRTKGTVININFPTYMKPETSSDPNKMVFLNGVSGIKSYDMHAEFTISEMESLQNDEDLEELFKKEADTFTLTQEEEKQNYYKKVKKIKQIKITQK